MSLNLKRTPADKWFSDCVRIRSNWHCENCQIYLEHDKARLHCSHFVGRGELSTRVHPTNAFAHCNKCHKKLGGDRWGGGNVAEFTHHFDSRRGALNRHFIQRLAKMPFRYYDSFIKDMSTHYREEFRRIESLRAEGSIKYEHFKMYDGAIELNATMKQIKQEIIDQYNEDGTLKKPLVMCSRFHGF